MKKLLVIGIIVLFLFVGLSPDILAELNEDFKIENNNHSGFWWFEITAPEPGIYVFGNKLLTAKEVIIIGGGFTIEATVRWYPDDIKAVSFYIDDNWISDDTSSPYSVYCAIKHSGFGIVKAIAFDWSGNPIEDTLDVYYYKFL